VRVDPNVEDANREKTDLSRRSFLVGLTVVGIGSATAMSLGANPANAAAESEIASGAKAPTLPESKKAEVVQRVDPNDPMQHFNQPPTSEKVKIRQQTDQMLKRQEVRKELQKAEEVSPNH
jgi:hypothetical protein